MKRFNLRVYGLVIHHDAVLVTDELRGGVRMTKFPGGGLEWGEGLKECLVREFMEELAQEPVNETLFYVTDFFQASAFREEDQLISFYYKLQLPWPESIPIVPHPFAFGEEAEGAQVFRWIKLSEITPGRFTYPVDKHVAEMLRKEAEN